MNAWRLSENLFFFLLAVPQGLLVALWVYMIYAMVQYARSHCHEEGWEIIVMVEFVIALGVTPYFGIAAQALDDTESVTYGHGIVFFSYIYF